ncbi:MAG: FtsQ-type POTRA domain-containing protein [Microbacteriaceae bacterium]|nr:FtsQ-type POTRA domain-containing protein [Microbacteriaceae bacterium]
MLSFGALVGVALLVTGIVMSPLLTLTTIVVKGRDVVPEDVIVGAAADQIGQPLASINFDSIRERLSAVPRIQSFATELQPPHTLVIRVVERQAIGALMINGSWSIVDVAGVVIDTQDAKPERFPAIDVPTTTDRAFTAIAETLAALPRSVRQRIAVISAETRDSVRFRLRGTGHQIIWGSPDESVLKVSVMERALEVANSRTGRYEIDVSAPDNIVLQPIS